MGSPIRAQIEVTVDASPAELWPYVADTDRMDRASGLPPVHFERSRRPEGGEATLGEYRVLGWPIARWLEHPFEWEYPRFFSVVREYQSGPLRRFYGGTEFLPLSSGGTRLRSFVEIIPRTGWIAPLVRYALAPVGLRRAARQQRAIAAYVRSRAPLVHAFPVLAQLRSTTDTTRLAQRMDRLIAEGAPEQAARQLERALATAADEDVAGMRPLELAERWGMDARQTLEVFVRATVAGVLELRWELLCPRCRGAKATANHLRDLAAGGYCPSCNLHFFADVDQSIEARFYPNPSIRKVDVGTYCIGNPTQTPQRLAQAELSPSGTVTWRIHLERGIYVVSSPQSASSVRLVVDGSGGQRAIQLTFVADAAAPDQVHLTPGEISIVVRNATTKSMTLALDDVRWSELGATPGRLMTLPAFRALLSTEALAPGFELALGRVGLLFTDLAGSTALYERIGDARAFKLVGQHFGLLSGPIERNGGALVKTIGDAIMAAFPDGRSAVSAGLEMQRGIRALQADGLVDAARLVKVGVHVGACYAVTLNDRLDYFGSAVNLAARAQNEARGGEVVATEAAIEESLPELQSRGLSWKPFDVELKGFTAPVRLYRIDVGAT